MRHIKHLLIWLLDRFDHLILRHRYYPICCWIGESHWWDGDKSYESGKTLWMCILQSVREAHAGLYADEQLDKPSE